MTSEIAHRRQEFESRQFNLCYEPLFLHWLVIRTALFQIRSFKILNIISGSFAAHLSFILRELYRMITLITLSQFPNLLSSKTSAHQQLTLQPQFSTWAVSPARNMHYG